MCGGAAGGRKNMFCELNFCHTGRGEGKRDAGRSEQVKHPVVAVTQHLSARSSSSQQFVQEELRDIYYNSIL